MARLAAVVTHYQTPRETELCLRSLRASTRLIDQLIVVDNGSEPRFDSPDVSVVRSETNLGFGAGCNLGIRRALADGADLVLIVNSDAEVKVDCVGLLESVLSARDDVGIVGPAVVTASAPARIESLGVRFSTRTGRMRNLNAGKLHKPAPPGLIEVEAVIGCCALIRRTLLERVGLFVGELFYGFEDLELCLRAARAGFRTVCEPAAIVRHGGARTIGARSPDRLYFATRNHLRVAELAAPLPLAATVARSMSIVSLNVAHALFTAPAPRLAGLRAVAHGARDHWRGRYGSRRSP